MAKKNNGKLDENDGDDEYYLEKKKKNNNQIKNVKDIQFCIKQK